MADDRYTGKTVTVNCPCGWRDALPASGGGMAIECPRCARSLTVPLFGASQAADLAGSERTTLEQLTGHRFARRGRRQALLLLGAAFVGIGWVATQLLTWQEARVAVAVACGFAAAISLFLYAFRR